MATVDRILELVKESGLTAKEFAIGAGIAGGSITDWKTGRSKPSVESLQKIAKFTNVQLEWLTGDIEFRTKEDLLEEYLKKQDAIVVAEFAEANVDEFIKLGFDVKQINEYMELFQDAKSSKDFIMGLDAYLKKFDSKKAKKLQSLIADTLKRLANHEKSLTIYGSIILAMERDKQDNEQASLEVREDSAEYTFSDTPQFYMCPVYGQISAGQPNWAEECIEGRIPIDPVMFGIDNPEECFFLRVNGESMNKVVKNNGFALIHKQDTAENGDIVAVLVNGYDATLKKFTKQGDLVILEPLSNDTSFTTQVYNEKTDIRILGKYIGKFEMNK